MERITANQMDKAIANYITWGLFRAQCREGDMPGSRRFEWGLGVH